MTKTLTLDVQHKNAERQLFAARRALSHLVELYESGQWKTLYKEAAFAETVGKPGKRSTIGTKWSANPTPEN